MAPRTLVRDAKPARPDGPVDDTLVSGSVDGYACTHVAAVEEMVLCPAKIAVPFFSGGGDESNGVLRLQGMAIDHAYQSEHCREAPSVVADARRKYSELVAPYAAHRVAGENSVEVGADHNCGAGDASKPRSNHVAGRIDVDVGEPVRLEALGDPCSAHALLARWSGNFGDFDLAREDFVVAR
jgi:hypothetical protein